MIQEPTRQKMAFRGNTRLASSPPQRGSSLGSGGSNWLRLLEARPRQLEAAGQNPWTLVAESWSPSDRSILCSLVQQKIWVHWLLWLVPYMNLFGGLISMNPMQNGLPFLISLLGFIGTLIFISVADASAFFNASVAASAAFVAFFAFGVFDGSFTQIIIQRARQRLAVKR